MKAETNDMHAVFLLKKNVRSNIIKIILEYLYNAVPKTLKSWKTLIILVEQRYESTKIRQDYRIGSEIIYEEKGTPMNIGKFKDNYNKDRKPKYFNYNNYGHMAKEYRKPKKEMRKCYKYNKVEHLAKNCRPELKMKNKSIQEESDKEDNKEKGFVKGLE